MIRCNSTPSSTAVPSLLLCLLLKSMILFSKLFRETTGEFSCAASSSSLNAQPWESDSVAGSVPDETWQHRDAKTLQWIPSRLIAPSHWSVLYFPVARR